MAHPTGEAMRGAVLCIKSLNYSDIDIHAITEYSTSSINHFLNKAKSCSFNPSSLPLSIEDTHVADAPRSGRLFKQTAELNTKIVELLESKRSIRLQTYAELTGILEAPEIKKNKEESAKVVEEMDNLLKLEKRQEWELNMSMHRLNIKQKTPGRVPQWQ
ncbi:hypothetical protein KEM56_002290 [Ascosphaera pollenicola]|nr:hypothetical protein KEM56_002290 [Ascosphaera pollenicola]